MRTYDIIEFLRGLCEPLMSEGVAAEMFTKMGEPVENVK